MAEIPQISNPILPLEPETTFGFPVSVDYFKLTAIGPEITPSCIPIQQSALRYRATGYPYGNNVRGKKRWLRKNRRKPSFRITIINSISCL